MSANISAELWDQFDKACRHYKKSSRQAITELIAAWIDRPDLAGSHRATSPVIQRAIAKADLSIEQIRNSSAKGWANLTEAVSDLIFLNQMISSKRYLEQAAKAAIALYGEDHPITRDFNSLRELWKARSASLSWDNSSTWQSGYPTSAGFFLVLPEKGQPRLSKIESEDHPDIRNDDIAFHLRIQPPPKQSKKARTEVQTDADNYDPVTWCVSTTDATYESNGRDPVKVTIRTEPQQELDDQPSPYPRPEQIWGDPQSSYRFPETLASLALREQQADQVDPSLDQLPGSQKP